MGQLLYPMSIDAPILIVEDDEGICHLLATALKKDGIVSECRTSGTSALTWLRQNHTPLILLDLRLPDMRGQDVIATLAEEGRKVPFVILEADESKYVSFLGHDRVASLGGRGGSCGGGSCCRLAMAGPAPGSGRGRRGCQRSAARAACA